ncbi:MAG TPA: MFS transporter, partial [Candidatus Dormibacteraeota bacterium]
GTRTPLLLDAAALALLAVGLGTIRARRDPDREHPRESRRRALGAGLRLLTRDPTLQRLMPPVLLVIVFVNVAVVVEVFLATRTFGAGPLGYGGLVAVWGAGLVLGTLAVPRLARLNPIQVTGAGAALGAIGLVGAGFSPGLAPALLAYAVGGFGNGLEMNSARIVVQRQAPATARGRAFAAYFAAGSGGAAGGAVVGGLLLGGAGPRAAMELAGAAVAGAAAWLFWLAGGVPGLRLRRTGARGSLLLGRPGHSRDPAARNHRPDPAQAEEASEHDRRPDRLKDPELAQASPDRLCQRESEGDQQGPDGEEDVA